MMSPDDVESLFAYHKLNDDGITRVNFFRERYKKLAFDIFNALPASPERTLAIRKLHESMMQVNVLISSEYPTE